MTNAGTQIAIRRHAPHAQTGLSRVLLVPSRGGWLLVTASGEVLLQRLGAGARRACLERARATGILSISS